MKKSIIISVNCLAVIIFSLILTSCDKKAVVAPMDPATIEFSYSPNPIIKNTPTTFRFAITDGMMMIDVTEYVCTYKPSKASSSSTLTLTRTGLGTYVGSCMFTSADSIKINFNCMNSMSKLTKDFVCIVN